MKTKININGKEVEIELTQEQVEAITKTSKNKLVIDYGETAFLSEYEDDAFEICTYSYRNDFYAKSMTRQTKELAEIARDNTVARNKLEELVHWLEPDWRAEWNDYTQNKFSVFYDYLEYKFRFSNCSYIKVIGTVYMSRQTAEKICNALNNGELPELAEILKG